MIKSCTVTKRCRFRAQFVFIIGVFCILFYICIPIIFEFNFSIVDFLFKKKNIRFLCSILFYFILFYFICFRFRLFSRIRFSEFSKIGS